MARFGFAAACLLFIVGFCYFFWISQQPRKSRLVKVTDDDYQQVKDRERESRALRPPPRKRTLLYYRRPVPYQGGFFALRTKKHFRKGERITKESVETVLLNNSKRIPFGVLSGSHGVIGSIAAMDIPQNVVLKADNLYHLRGAIMQGPDGKKVPFQLYVKRHGWNYE